MAATMASRLAEQEAAFAAKLAANEETVRQELQVCSHIWQSKQYSIFHDGYMGGH